MTQTQVNFVLGPAGSGKTTQFIESVRQQLIEAPQGPPLLFLAPKQATFQIEEQLLNDETLHGFTRLQILSFPRLAEHVLSEFAPDQSHLLGDDGRLMIIRSLLNRHSEELRSFKSVANYPSFANEIGAFMVELQRHHINAPSLRELSARSDIPSGLALKLHDLSLMVQKYREWLELNELKDADTILDLATQQLQNQRKQAPVKRPFFVHELWLDGFAAMTPQELDLLTAIVAHCRCANLAFCLDPDETSPQSWLSVWTAPSETYDQCRHKIAALETPPPKITRLTRNPESTRFRNSPELRHLESQWAAPTPFAPPIKPQTSAIEMVHCANQEDEVIHAARRILEFVRDGGFRYRQIGVFTRSLEDYSNEILQVFNRFQIPYFIDQREPIDHHPAVVLTRVALRLIAFHWQSADLIAALKTQLVSPDLNQINELENLSIEFGLEGAQWRHAFDQRQPRLQRLEGFRQLIIRPFLTLNDALTSPGKSSPLPISGTRLVTAIKAFWETCKLSETLEQWDTEEAALQHEDRPPKFAIHAGAWEELQLWIDNVELAFAESHRTLRDWLPILEAGLNQLSVGIIPPTTDQVIIGSIDRSRSPNLAVGILLGLNESLFPRLPKPHPILSESEREQLGARFETLVPSVKRALATERFYAYIACTRATHHLIASYADRAADGSPLSPSSIIAHLQRLVPSATQSKFKSDPAPEEAQHISELIQPLFCHMASQGTSPPWAEAIDLLRPTDWLNARFEKGGNETDDLLPPLPALLYTQPNGDFPTSVSRLEQFAACPFRFFVHSGLRAEERLDFQIDQKRIGSFQHLILETFHHEIVDSNRAWRQVPPGEARSMIASIAHSLSSEFNYGLFNNSAEARFSLEAIIQRLQEFVTILIEWMDQYNFDPSLVELGFGGAHDSVGPWTVALEKGRMVFVGKIDRLDILQSAPSNEAYAVIIDYKSSGKTLDPILLAHGIQLQLLAYLNVVAQAKELASLLKSGPIKPAGVFFVPLRGYSKRQPNRDLARQSHHDDRPKAFQHIGCFDSSLLRDLDNRSDCLTGDQIQYRLKRDGSPRKNAWNVMSPDDFRATMKRTEQSIQSMGNQILAGDVTVAPYQHREATPCLYCPYPSICRIDPTEHPFRKLSSTNDPDSES